jgi:hypothetical protein
MLYVDYIWDLSPTTIIPDCEINTGKLEWKSGDYWQMVEHDGKLVLKKVDPMVQFLMEGHCRGCS